MKMEDNASQSDLDHLILGEMCIQAGKGVELQCKRESWDDDPDTARATPLHTLASDQQKKSADEQLECREILGQVRLSCIIVSQTLEQDVQGKED